MRKTKSGKLTIGLFLIILGLSSCVSRLSRPEISGVIVGYDNKPVAGCKIGEAVTGINGHFILREQRYQAFMLSEIMVMEAPPLMVHAPIEKDGFEKDAVSLWSPRGGGQSKGAKYNLDTIYLKRNDEQFDIPALLNNSKWRLSYNKTADTIYLVKYGFTAWCKTDRCGRFYSSYEALTDNQYADRVKNLPEGIIKRFIDIELESHKSVLKIQEIDHYARTSDEVIKKPDTLIAGGSWKLTTDNLLWFDIHNMKSISGKFKLSDIDLYQLRLIRTE